MDFTYTPEQRQLRDAVSALGRKYGHGYFVAKAKAGQHTTELWAEAGKLGYLGVNVPAEYDGVAVDYTTFARIFEELARGWLGLAGILGTHLVLCDVITTFGTDDQKRRDLYVLAYTIIRADESVTGAERVYLAQLAHQLGLDAATTAKLEQDTASKIDATPDNA